MDNKSQGAELDMDPDLRLGIQQVLSYNQE